jgi:sugar lactone lactonase YvrE
LPAPVAGKGFVAGLAVHGDDLYGALVSFVPDVQAGVYRVGAAGAPAQLYAKHAEMAFPNGIAFDDAGTMYVTDSAAGAVFRVSTSGEVVKWLADPLLAGGKDACGEGMGVGVPFDIGANGIVVDGDTVFVSNTDRAQLVRIPIQADGSAGAPSLLVAPSCADLSGADGLALAPDGDLIVAVNHLDKLVRVDREGHLTALVAGDPLDFPASLGFAGGALYISNFAFLDGKRPALLRIR